MKNLLFIAYYFPPAGGGGVQRSAKFARYLPSFGWRPVVLSVSTSRYGIRDESMLSEIPPQLRVLRPGGLRLPGWLPWRVRRWLVRWLLLVDEQTGWIPAALRQGRKLLEEESFQAIYSSSTPYSAHLVARQLKLTCGLPWLADFRDPWIGNLSANYPTAWHFARNRELEAAVIESADLVVGVSSPMQSAFRQRYPAAPAQKFQVISNGFDAQDFAVQAAPAARFNSPGQPAFEIVYSGSFYGEHRTPETFFQGLSIALQHLPAGRIKARLCGNLGSAVGSLVEKLKLQDAVQIDGYLTHHQTIQRLLAADALLLIIGQGPGSQAVMTGKIFEYLAAGKPILALAPEGAAADLLNTAQVGLVVPPNDPQAVAHAILDLFAAWQAGTPFTPASPALLAQYERKNLTARLADMLDQLTGQ